MQRYARYFNVFVFDESIEVRKYLIDYFIKNQSGQISHLWTVKIHSIVNLRDLERRLKKNIPHIFFLRKDIEATELTKIEETISGAYPQGISVDIMRIDCSKVVKSETLMELAASI